MHREPDRVKFRVLRASMDEPNRQQGVLIIFIDYAIPAADWNDSSKCNAVINEEVSVLGGVVILPTVVADTVAGVQQAASRKRD